MYSVTFTSTKGDFVFSTDNNIVSDFNIGESVVTNITKSQGLNQIGSSVKQSTVSDRQIICKGVIFRDVSQIKNNMRKMITPFSKGKLVFDDKYEIDVVVTHSPSFSPVKDDGNFVIEFLAPYPFLRKTDKNVISAETLTKEFRLPIRGVRTFRFGTSQKIPSAIIQNDSDVISDFDVYIKVLIPTSNITYTEKIDDRATRLTGSFSANDCIAIFRDSNQYLRCILINSGKNVDELERKDFANGTNIAERVSDDSNFFSLRTGKNEIDFNDASAGNNIAYSIRYSEVITAYYEY